MTPADKHIAAIEAELERHIMAGNVGVSPEAVRKAIALLPKLPGGIPGESRIKVEGNNAVLEIIPGIEILVRIDGTFALVDTGPAKHRAAVELGVLRVLRRHGLGAEGLTAVRTCMVRLLLLRTATE